MKNLFQKVLNLGHKKSAQSAKERLQIVVSHQRVTDSSPEFLPELRQELLQVISKYMTINLEQINVNLQKVGNCSILELNVAIPESAAIPATKNNTGKGQLQNNKTKHQKKCLAKSCC